MDFRAPMNEWFVIYTPKGEGQRTRTASGFTTQESAIAYLSKQNFAIADWGIRHMP